MVQLFKTLPHTQWASSYYNSASLLWSNSTLSYQLTSLWGKPLNHSCTWLMLPCRNVYNNISLIWIVHNLYPSLLECRSIAWWGHRADSKWRRWFHVQRHDDQHGCPWHAHYLREPGWSLLTSGNLRRSSRQGACLRRHPSGPPHRWASKPPDIISSSSTIPASVGPSAPQSLSLRDSCWPLNL